MKSSTLMYNHRAERNRVDVVDLDPYGTAAPFVDASVQCVNDGGMSELIPYVVETEIHLSRRSSLCHMHRHVRSGHDELP